MDVLGIRLDVDFREKELAKQLGAKWCNEDKTWYVPLPEELEEFIEWLPKEALVYENGGIERIFMEIRGGYPCFKCKKTMDILQTFPKPPRNIEHTRPEEYCDNTWSKPKSFVAFAERLGISMDYRKTSMVDRPYAIHVCPHCGNVQGDFYIFEDADCRLPVKAAFFVRHDLKKDTWEIE